MPHASAMGNLSPKKQPRQRPDSGPDCLKIPRRIRRSGLAPRVKLLLEAIADHVNFGQSHCWASAETLGLEVGITPRHIRNLVEILV